MGGKSSTPRRSPIPSTEPLHYTLLAATLPKKKFDPFAEMNNGSKVENLGIKDSMGRRWPLLALDTFARIKPSRDRNGRAS
ncbi:uncharacterized protein LOC110008000 isoform X3 [Amborella trichopoda]|uniref:uncharacterized protein LOC110008000 isoform X3 n=1 Tax=Amborella trichopoda TaxID=13333 RepID=UPI0009BFF86F|nr:uncharacterized protein LOC110008000 isoform X3 [Amborella trichopoda]|eukprot:XP_020528370.1 uncharacterized protein LOC110008000 isoform X3 [Amborella trichopoda]